MQQISAGSSQRRRSGRSRRLGREERIAIGVLAGSAAVVGAAAPAAPTGLAVWDELLTAGFAAAVVLAASPAKRWTWLVLSGLAAMFVGGVVWFACALTALALAVVSTLANRRARVLGALVGALSVVALLRLSDVGFHGFTALVVAAAVGPVFWVGYRYSSSRSRRRVRVGLIGVGAPAGLVLVAVFVALIDGRAEAQRGIDAARSGLEAARSGDQPLAAQRLRSSAGAFGSAESTFGAPWLVPARLIPVVGQNVDALRRVSARGAEVSAAAARAAEEADVEQLTAVRGAVDVGTLAAMVEPLEDAVAALTVARATVADIDSGWLVSPIARRLDSLATEMDDALPDALLAAEAARVVPGLLGADGPRRYLALFGSPAETRELGGFLASFGVVSVDAGLVSLERFGENAELNAAGPAEFGDPAAWPDRFRLYSPGVFSQNFTGTPDFPTVAAAAAELYPAMGGEPVDGVIYVDPAALAALLELSGPLRVPGVSEELTSENLVGFLLRDQYVLYPDNDERNDLLATIAEAAFDALLDAELPGPRRLGDVLGPVARQDRLLFITFDDTERALLEQLLVDGAFPDVGGGDFLSVVHADAAANKLDAYLRRDVAYDVTIDPAGGELEATVTVTFTNDAHAGLPRYVLGDPAPGIAPATAQTLVSIYTAQQLDGVTVDGDPVEVETQVEYGRNRYLVFVTTPPDGGVSTVTYTLRGGFGGPRYDLVLANQPLAHDDRVTLRVRTADGWVIDTVEAPAAVERTNDTASVVFDHLEDVTVSVVPVRR